MLGAVTDPRSGRPWAEGAGAPGGPEKLHVSVRRSGKVHAVLEFPDRPGEAETRLGAAMEDALKRIDGVSDARIVLTAQGAQREQAKHEPPPRPEGVARLLAVASAKGGVGKSTVAVNLALALAASGWRVGLLDADIYGPSLPIMLGTQDTRPDSRRRDGRTVILPINAHGIASLSIGNLAAAETAVAWRGPMVSGALLQLIGEVDWGELDLLLIDTPPGTGDVLLTLSQGRRLDGAVIVTTPQNVALADVRRGVSLFEKAGVPVLGLIENMAWFESADGTRVPIFGGDGSGGEETARLLGTVALGRIPLDPEIGAASDAGRPAVLAGGGVGAIFAALAARVRAGLEAARPAAPGG